MRRVSFGIVGVAVGAAVLTATGCANFRPSTFYTLSSLNEPADLAPSETGGKPLVIAIRPIGGLPQYLDRPQIVTRVSPNRLDLAEFNRWAEPLARSFSRVLVDNLSILLATEQITLYGRESSTPPDFQILLNVTRFDGTLGGSASLVARWSITGKDGSVVAATTKSTINVPTGAAGYEALAAALSQTIAGLCREIAAAIKAHPAG